MLIIGSGIDLKGRKMKQYINNFNGVVIRCNKLYGGELDDSDVGSRTDIMFTRWRSWIGRITPKLNDADYVVVNDLVGISKNEMECIYAELGHTAASCGLVAVAFCLHRGARSVTVVGFGHSGASRGFFPKQYTCTHKEKQTLETSRYNLDKNPHYDWTKENDYLVNNGVRLI